MPADTAERWKKVSGFPLYEVSDLGNVRSLWRAGEPVPMKVRTGRLNRLFVDLSTVDSQQRCVAVARIVLLAFSRRKPRDGEVVGYRDFNPANCRADNLYWTTRSEASKARRVALTAVAA